MWVILYNIIFYCIVYITIYAVLCSGICSGIQMTWGKRACFALCGTDHLFLQTSPGCCQGAHLSTRFAPLQWPACGQKSHTAGQGRISGSWSWSNLDLPLSLPWSFWAGFSALSQSQLISLSHCPENLFEPANNPLFKSVAKSHQSALTWVKRLCNRRRF